jgi:Fic family protein
VSKIRQHDAGVRTMPGTKIANLRGETIYTPPTGKDRLLALLDDLCKFIHARDGIDPLIKLAVIHYQFEAIHPFSDGNGRTGRIINVLYLVQMGLIKLPVLYLSGYIIANKQAYYRGIKRVTEEGAWEEWILYMLDAIEVTSADTCLRIREIRSLIDITLQRIREQSPKLASKELVELVFQQPYTRISTLTSAGIAQRQTAAEYLQKLEQVGILASVRFGKEKLFINRRLFEILVRPLEDKR